MLAEDREEQKTGDRMEELQIRWPLFRESIELPTALRLNKLV